MLVKKSDPLSKLFFHVGFFLLTLLAITLITSSIVFLFHGVMGPWQFPISVVLAYMLSYYYNYRDEQGGASLNLYLFIGLPLIILVISLLITAYFYDISYDGQAYHQETLIQLKNKWNPNYQFLPDKINQAIWINHYAKGMETIQAAIYCSFGNIEVGKSTNIILWLGSFFITLSYLLKSGLSLKKTALISFFFATSPIVFNQLLTFYVDGPLASMLLYLFITCLLIIKDQSSRYLILLGAIIIMLINVKFTGIFYLALFVGGILLWLLYNKKTVISKKIWWSSVAAGIIAILIGFNPYITNTINFGHPLYPLMGAKKVNIINELNLPSGFQNKSGAERFFLSTFSHTDNIYPWTDHQPQLKIPFTLNRVEIVTAPQVDTRIGGFGPMFSGILILSTVLFILLYFTKRDQLFFRNLGYLSILIIISIIVFPEAWWARYVPQFWFLPVAWLLATEVQTNRYNLLKNVIYVALLINFAFCFGGVLINLTVTQKINYELAVLKSSNQKIQVNWGASASNRVRFWNKNIPYEVIDMGNDIKYDYFASSEAILINVPPDVSKKIKKPLWLRYAEKWIPLRWSYYGR